MRLAAVSALGLGGGLRTACRHGLLVPVVGTLTLVRENGEPSHFLLETSAP